MRSWRESNRGREREEPKRVGRGGTERRQKPREHFPERERLGKKESDKQAEGLD